MMSPFGFVESELSEGHRNEGVQKGVGSLVLGKRAGIWDLSCSWDHRSQEWMRSPKKSVQREGAKGPNLGNIKPLRNLQGPTRSDQKG